MSQVHAVRRNPFSRLLGEAGIAFLCGLIFSGAEIGSLPSPLPLAIAGCLSSTGAIAVLIGTLLRYLMSDLLLERLPLLFALLLITCARLFLRNYHSAAFLSLCTGGCTLFSGILLSFLMNGTAQDFLLYGMTACLTGTTAWFLHTVLLGLQNQQKIQLKSATGCAAAIVYILCIAALTSFDYPFMNFGRILGIAVTLLAARRFRYMCRRTGNAIAVSADYRAVVWVFGRPWHWADDDCLFPHQCIGTADSWLTGHYIFFHRRFIFRLHCISVAE